MEKMAIDRPHIGKIIKQTIVKGPNDEFVTEFSGVSGDGKWMIGAFGFSASKWSKEEV